MQADALLFQETGTDFKEKEIQTTLKQMMKFYHQNHTTTPTNYTVPTKNKIWQPGGTLSSILGRWIGAKKHLM